MYGQPIDPNKASFELIDGLEIGLEGILVFIQDDEDTENDDIREIVDPKFDESFPYNEMENVFSAKEGKFESLEGAKVFLLSLGFTETTGLF